MARLGVFRYIADAPAAHRPFHYLILASNELWTEIPGFMLDAVATPSAFWVVVCCR
jgi:hypothetical protein